jgi:hypothetical protein
MMIPEAHRPHYIGVAAGHGTAAFRHGASVTLGRAEVGAALGHGTLLIEDGANVSAGALRIGYSDNGNGTVILSGATSRLTIGAGECRVGPGVSDSLLRLQDGTLTVAPRLNRESGIFTVRDRFEMNGGYFDSRRTISVSYPGAVTVNGSVAMIEEFRTRAGGTTTIAGGSVNVGTATVDGGTLLQTGGSFNAESLTMFPGDHNWTSYVYLSGGAFNVGHLTIYGGGIGGSFFEVLPGSSAVPRVGTYSVSQTYIELADSGMIVDYTGGSPIDQVRADIGSEIRSSSVGSGYWLGVAEASSIFSSFPATFLGQSVDDTSVLILYTRHGDANFDRVVNLADFNRLASNFGQSGMYWSDGDFNNDGFVNLIDFNMLAAQFGLVASLPNGPTPQDWAALAATMPEPTCAATVAGCVMLGRRVSRRRS